MREECPYSFSPRAQDGLRAPFSAYQQALEVAEKATEQGRATFQKAIEDFEKTARQPQHAAKREAKK